VTPVTTLAGRSVAVFGLGASGLATCRALAAGGARVVAFDDAPHKVAEAAAEGFATADLHACDWSKIACLVLTPGVPLTHPTPHWAAALAQAAGVEVIGDIELFARERARSAPRAPFVAITGTNGKSTTTALVAHILRTARKEVALGGNIGVPILALAPPADGRHHVIEVSSYQIDLAPSLAPSVGILINLTPDHLDRHGSMEHYAAVKARLVAAVAGDGAAVVGVDDAWCRAIAERIEAAGKPVVRVSVETALAHGLYADGPRIMEAPDGTVREVARIDGIGSLRGVHNAQNAACATAAALALGLEPAAIQAGLKTFPGLAHRMEEVGRKGRVLFVNDSKATNADAAARALASFRDIYWIAGGKAKAGGIASLSAFFPRIRKAYLIGEAARDFATTLEGAASCEVVRTLDRAVAAAARDAAAAAVAEPVVLLSPACASFDQFPNFEARGAAFRDLVHKLDGVEPMKEAS
jgi:UDP-N-acetylmuramoylalanine--D-glutamate ligase